MPCSAAALPMISIEFPTQAETIGFSTRVSVEITWTVLRLLSGGRAAIAVQISCSVVVESFPPEYPMIQGTLSAA